MAGRGRIGGIFGSQKLPGLRPSLHERVGSQGNTGGEGPYVAWVKEGRKYNLGAVLITQQPGSISNEILSQGDNWFIFHLLSAGDLMAVKKANAHFSDDILSSLLNEPIPGHGVFWSSVKGKSYPIPVRVLPFDEHQAVDPEYNKPAARTYAIELRERLEKEMEQFLRNPVTAAREDSVENPESVSEKA